MKTLALILTVTSLLAACDPTATTTPHAASPGVSASPAPPPAAARVDVRGRVADVRRHAADGGGTLATILVEGRRDPDTGYDAASVRVTSATKLGFKATGRDAALDDVVTGALVEVRFTGPVAESHPVQGTAAEIAILDAPPGKSLETDAGPFDGTTGIVDRPGRATGTAVLRDVRSARHDGFDRTVFEFEGGALPAYHLEYVDKPVRQCGSGDPTPIRGDGWLHVRFTGAAAHTDAGEATVGFREKAVDLPNLLELQSICDFEGEVGWVLGVRSPNRYRAVELSAPTRLVVDVAHR